MNSTPPENFVTALAVGNMTLLDSFICSMAWPPLIQSLFAHVPSVSFSNINNKFNNNPKSTSIMRWMDLERVAHISRFFEKSTPLVAGLSLPGSPDTMSKWHLRRGSGLRGSGRFRVVDFARRPGMACIHLELFGYSRHL